MKAGLFEVICLLYDVTTIEDMLMAETSAGISELRAQLSHYLRQVAAGDTVIITERGQPVGRIVPVNTTAEQRLQQMAAIGLVAWSGRKLQPAAPVERIRGSRCVADLLLEDRE
jgi:prevent-host-death family protein